MLKKIAMIYGIIFIVIGILGFIPVFTPNGLLLGMFMVNGLHNIIHLVTGVVAVWIGKKKPMASRPFFKVFGVIYAIVAILGFFYQENPIFGLIANNPSDTWLHVVIALITLYLGYWYKDKKERR